MHCNIRIEFMIFFLLLSNTVIQLQSQSKKLFSRWFFFAVMRVVRKVFQQDLIATSMRNWKNMLLKLQIEKYLVMKRMGLFSCPTTDCATTSKYKYNIIKHLKLCRKVNTNKKGGNENKTSSFCSKVYVHFTCCVYWDATECS